MNIHGTRVSIRPTQHADLPFLQALWNDAAVMRHHGYPDGMHVTEESMERWWQSRQTPGTPPDCVITLLDGEIIGELTYAYVAQQRASIDLKLATKWWKQGYAREALNLALQELFADAAVKKIVVEPTPDNVSARALMARCGFQPAPTENHPFRWECTPMDFAKTQSTIRA